MKRKSIYAVIIAIAAVFIENQAFSQELLSSEMLEVCDSLAMVPPVIRKISQSDLAKYSVKTLDYGMTLGIEKTPCGRIWNCFIGGGDNADAYLLINWSDNGGKKWTDVKFVVDPHDNSLPFKRRTIVGQLWTDPDGRLWLFMDQAMTYFDGRSANWCAVCENPDADEPVWSEPRYIGFGCTLNKPTVMSTGEWVLPVSLWVRSRINVAKEAGWEQSPFTEAHHELDSLRGAHCFVSEDKGHTWEDRSFVCFPSPSFDEHIFIELEDGRWWMTARTGEGICQSFSSDRGRTWTAPEHYSAHVNSRHFITRLQSGDLLIVRHGMPDKKLKGRSHLRAFISDDDGKTWKGCLLLDERSGISYPTGFQDKDGYIYISYDYERTKCGELYMAKFREEDILAQQLVSPKGFLGKLIYRPGRVKFSAANRKTN